MFSKILLYLTIPLRIALLIGLLYGLYEIPGWWKLVFILTVLIVSYILLPNYWKEKYQDAQALIAYIKDYGN